MVVRMKRKIKIKLTEKDLEEFRKFHKNHIKGVKCYLSYENNELCLHERLWLLKKAFGKNFPIELWRFERSDEED